LLVCWVFGWSGGKQLVGASYADASAKTTGMKEERKEKRTQKRADRAVLKEQKRAERKQAKAARRRRRR
jgi:hypothetical protein